MNPKSYCKEIKQCTHNIITCLGGNSVAHSFCEANPWWQFEKLWECGFIKLQVMKLTFSLEKLHADFVGRKILREPKTKISNKWTTSLTHLQVHVQRAVTMRGSHIGPLERDSTWLVVSLSGSWPNQTLCCKIKVKTRADFRSIRTASTCYSDSTPRLRNTFQNGMMT